MENFFNKRYRMVKDDMTISQALLLFSKTDFNFRKTYLKVVTNRARAIHSHCFGPSGISNAEDISLDQFTEVTHNILNELCNEDIDDLIPIDAVTNIQMTNWALRLSHYIDFIRDFSGQLILEEDIKHVERIINLSDPGGKIFLECINESIY